MLYLVNPRRKAKAKKAKKARRKKASPAQMRARRKFAAMAKARARAARKAPKRATSGGRTMATKRRRKATKRRRRSTARRSPVTRLRRHAVYATNPRRKARRRYRRNPGMGSGIVGTAVGLAKDAGAGLIGAALGRTVSNMIPIGGTSPVVSFAKNAIVAIAIKQFGKRFLGERFASYAAVGAMIGPTRDLIVSFVPGASGFLGENGGVTYFPTTPAYRSLQAYSDVDGTSADMASEVGMGSYSGDVYSM